jgi:filamentous hemagglutinin family protein
MKRHKGQGFFDMNALCYKIVFSKRLGTLVAVGEHISGQGKTASGTATRSLTAPILSSTLKTSALAIALGLFANSIYAAGPVASALPTGASVNSGNVAISTQGAAMTIQQSSGKASVNWNSFNIGSAAAVNITQPSANSVLLNRVVGNDPSQIFGKLSANGQVVLINPNGVVFGQGGSVTASAFTASTFGLSDNDFAKGKYNYTRNGSTAGVTVQNGNSLNATAPGGYVALIGASVNNEGTIATKQGSVVMAAGEAAALPSALTDNVSVPLSGKVRLELAPSTLNASVANSGVITSEGGQVLMQTAAISDAVASISHSGSINTTGTQGGAVTLQADGGIIQVNGSIKANSTDALRVGGDIIIGRDTATGVLAKATDVSGAKLESQGGFVETSGEYLKTSNISVKAAEWLLDPTDITIVATGTAATDVPSVTSAGTTTFQFTGAGRTDTSEVLKADIESAINNGTNVTLDSRHGTSFGAGNITIATALSFNNTGASNATLRLSAVNGIIQNSGSSITGTGTKLVNIVMDTQGRYSGQPVDNVNSKGIVLNSTINTNGTVNLTGLSRNTNGGLSSSGVVFNTGSGITASSFTVSGEQAIPSAGVEYAGIYFAGNNTFTSSSGASTMNGTSTSSGIGIGGVYIPDGARVNFNSGAGSIVVTGSNSYAKGIRFGNTSANAVINTNGNVTFDGGNEMFLRAALNIQSGSTSLKGNLVSVYNAGNVVASNGTTLNLEGETVSLGAGAYTSIAPSANSNFTLNIKADVYSLYNSSTVNVGSGTVNFTTKTAGNEIRLGTGSSAGILGLSQVDLDSISAGQLTIGDANTTGLITTYSVTTGSATGHLTLRSRGGIAVNGALAVGGLSGSRNLTLYGSDTASASNTTEGSSGSIKAAGLELKGSNATHTLTGTSNDIDTLAGSTLAVTFVDNNGFAVGTVNSTGLTTSGNTSLTAGTNATVTQSAAIQTAGLELKGTTASYTLSNSSNDIATLAGNVKTLSYTDATGFAVGTVNTQGLTTSGITTLEAGANGGNANVTQSKIITASALELKGSQASYTLNGAGAADNVVSTLAANAKAVAFTNASALSIGTVNTTVGITTNAGASIITKSGDLNVNQAISNTGAGVSGDIVIGAGTSTAAGTGSGGDVKTTNGIAITQANSSGKTFIYTGQASSTGTLSYLNASLSNLDLSAIDGGPQNADSNVGYPANNFGISGSTASAQVMFRAQVAIGALLGDTLTKTYGDSATKSTTSSTLFADMQAQLKTKNTGISIRTDAAAGTLRISNSALIDTLSGNLSNASYSGSGYLNTNSSGYGYGALSSSKFTYSLAANNAKVAISKATAKLSAQRTYNGTTALSSVTIDTGVLGTDGVTNETLTFSGASSNNKNVSANGSNFITAITLANGSNGGDASNYTYMNSYDSVNNHVTISQAALSVTANAVTKTYDGTLNATGTGTVGTLAGAGDSVSNAGAQAYLDKNYGINNKSVRAYGVSIKDANNTDVTSNYNISYIDHVTSTINQAALTIKVNDTSMFVTQDARAATNQLYSYSGFKNGETEANALNGGALVAANRSYTDPANTLVAYHPTAGSYSGVYGLTAAPTAVNNNYAITVQNGDLRVIPADKLLITIARQVDSYGNRTAANAGLASNGSVSAQYCLLPSDCTGSNLVDLTLTKLNGTEWKATDSSGSSVMFSTTLTSPSYSTGGYVNAGNYIYDTTQINPLSLPNGNFTGRETNGGVLTINPIAANLSSSSASKVYDGTTDISGVSLTLNNLQSGDAVKGAIGLGTLASKNAGSNVSATFSGISLSGLDAANYYLTSTTLVGSATVIPKPLTLIGVTVGNKTFDGNTSSSITSNGTLLGLVGVEALTLFGLTGTFDSASVGQGKTVNLTATLLDGNNGGLASNYSLAPATALADINVASSNQATPRAPIINPTNPVLPNMSGGTASRASISPIANPYVSVPQPHAENAERCSLNAHNSRKAIEVADDYSGCLCETQNTLGIDGLSICYEPKQTADNKTSRKPRI